MNYPKKRKKLSLENRKKLSEARLRRKEKLGYINSKETRLKIGLSKIGNKNTLGKHWKMSNDTKEKIRQSLLKFNSTKIKVTKYYLSKDIRNTKKYNHWRSSIFFRDSFTCQECKKTNCRLQVHHIKPLRRILKENNIKNMIEAMKCNEIWNIDNGISLCIPCHKKTDTFCNRN